MLAYQQRVNDIVESRLDLEQSTINNLSVFFNSFQRKLIYEIKLVSSITTQDGTTQTGQSHQTTTGYYANGTPKYKTIVNKFAVMDIFLVLPGKSRQKLTRIVLAPVNILKYNPKKDDLDTESNSVKLLILTGNIAPIITTTPVVTPVVTPTPQETQALTTLYAYYSSKGATLPTITERSVIYESYGIGPRGTYVGTAEQNNALLAKLQTPAPSSSSTSSNTSTSSSSSTNTPASTSNANNTNQYNTVTGAKLATGQSYVNAQGVTITQGTKI